MKKAAMLLAGLLPALAFAGAPDTPRPSSPAERAAALSATAAAVAASPVAAVPASPPAEALSTSPAAAAVAPARLPLAPTALTGWFHFVTHSAKPAVPTVFLRWEPARQTDYLVDHYKIQVLAADTTVTSKSHETTGNLDHWKDEGVDTSRAVRYRLLTVDSAGQQSAPTAPLRLDLAAVPQAVRAPLAPSGFKAQSRREDVSLQWNMAQPMQDPISHYRVYRSEKVRDLWNTQPRMVTETSLVDKDLQLKEDYFYGVQVVDEAGRLSPKSVTLSARATGTLPPAAPVDLTATAGIEKVLLQWEAPKAGTAPVSRYHIVRRDLSRKGEKGQRTFAPRKPLDLKYSDGKVDGGQAYTWEVYAIDQEGNTSPASTVTATPLEKPYDWSSVFIMPTAFSNNPEKNLRGWNVSVLFDFYVGALYETYEDKALNRTKDGVFQRIQVGTFSGDFKYSLWGDQKYIPGLATGLYTVSLLSLGQPSGSGGGTTVAATSSGDNSFETFGGAYISMSKRLWGKAAIHAGYMRGNLAQDLRSVAPEGWSTTIHHLTPFANMSNLMDRLVDPSLGVPLDTPPDLLFASLKLPFTIPGLGKRTALELEALTPVPENADDNLPIMISIGLENVQTFGFEFAYVHFEDGYEVLAYYHFRDLSWAW